MSLLERSLDAQFKRWYPLICDEALLNQANQAKILSGGQPLSWEVAYEVLAYGEFRNGALSPDAIVQLSQGLYDHLDTLWRDVDVNSRDSIAEFYNRSVEAIPWGHGTFDFDHNVLDRRKNWLRRLALLHTLQALGSNSVIDYGAGSGHTSLLAKGLGFNRVAHFEYSVFHPFVEWRLKKLTTNPNCQFQFYAAEQPFTVEEKFDAAVCFDVAEHVFDLDGLLTALREAIVPGGI